MYDFRNLSTESDLDLFREAYGWAAAYPRRFAGLVDYLSWEEFFGEASDGRQVDVGLFDGSRFVALITLRQVAEGTHEIHLLVERGVSLEKGVEAVREIILQALYFGARRIFAWIYSRHLGLIRLCRAVGLLPTGGTATRGAWRGRPCVLLEFACERELRNDEEQDADEPTTVGFDNADLRLAADSRLAGIDGPAGS